MFSVSLCTFIVLFASILHLSATSNTTTAIYNHYHPTKDPNDADDDTELTAGAGNSTRNDPVVIHSHEEPEVDGAEVFKLRGRVESNKTHQGSGKVVKKTARKMPKSKTKATGAPKSGTKTVKQSKHSGKSGKEKFKMLARQYIIRLKDEIRPEMVENVTHRLLDEIKSLAQKTEPNLQVQIGHMYMNTIKGFSISNFPDELASLLLTLPGVISIEQDYEAYLDLPPQDNITSSYNESNSMNQGDRSLQGCVKGISWGITRVGGPIYRSYLTRRVFIVDTGIAPFFSELTIDTRRSKDFTGVGSWYDDHGHGTHVAGTIAGKCRVLGVVPGATVVAIKVCNRDGTTVGSSFLAGVDHVGKYAVAGDVVNMSLGARLDPGTPDFIEETIIINLADKGIKFAIAAGNDGINAELISPARVNRANVYTVSALLFDGRLAWFSNFGSPPIDYAAPGLDIVSLSHAAVGTVTTYSGTSMAAPHVAGLLYAGDVTSEGVISGDMDTTPYPIIYKKETAWHCVRRGIIVNSVTLWSGHTTSAGTLACNKLASCKSNSCSAVFTEMTKLCVDNPCNTNNVLYLGGIGNWASIPREIGNDALSYVYIPKGYTFQYFEQGNYSGWWSVFGSYTNATLLSMPAGQNDAVSSFRIRRFPNSQLVKLCRDNPCSSSGVYYARVGAWSSMPSEIGDNALSFVYIPPGYQCQFFQLNNYLGWNITYVGGTTALNVALGGGYNDAVSSFKINLI